MRYRLLALILSVGLLTAGSSEASASMRTLTVDVEASAGVGATTVISDPAGINCTVQSGRCAQASFPEGTVVKLQAVGAPGVLPITWASNDTPGVPSSCTMVPGDAKYTRWDIPYPGGWTPRACQVTLAADATRTISSAPERTLRVRRYVGNGYGPFGSAGIEVAADWDTAPGFGVWQGGPMEMDGFFGTDSWDKCGSRLRGQPPSQCLNLKVPAGIAVIRPALGQGKFEGWAGEPCVDLPLSGPNDCAVSVVDGDRVVDAKFADPDRVPSPAWCAPSQNFDYYQAQLNAQSAFADCDLSFRELSGADFSGSRLSGPDVGFRLVRVCFRGADLREANFRNTRGAGFGGSDMGMPCWRGADLSGADFTGSDSFAGVVVGGLSQPWATVGAYDDRGNLPRYDRTVFGDVAPFLNIQEGADLSTARFTGSKPLLVAAGRERPDSRKLPDDWRLACSNNALQACLVLQPDWSIQDARKSLEAAVKALKWTGLDVTTLWQGVDLAGADLTDSDLSGVDLTGASAGSAGASIARNSPLGAARLRRATLTGARLDQADLKVALMDGVRSGGVRGKPKALPRGWVLVRGYLVGPGANLSKASLRGADLRKADLTGANLAGARLDGARLKGTRIRSIKGKPARLPSGWSLARGTLRKRR